MELLKLSLKMLQTFFERCATNHTVFGVEERRQINRYHNRVGTSALIILGATHRYDVPVLEFESVVGLRPTVAYTTRP
jgi:hypothetical protein